MEVNTSVLIYWLAMLPEDTEICPFCHRKLGKQMAQCSLRINGEKQRKYESLLFCENCKVHFGNKTILNEIERGEYNATKYSKRYRNKDRNTVRVMQSFDASRKRIKETRLLVYGCENPDIQTSNTLQVQSPPKEDFVKSRKEANLSRTFSKIIPIPFRFSICPYCRRELQQNYTHAVPYSSEGRVFIRGASCDHCNAFYTEDKWSIDYLRKMASGKATGYAIIDDFQDWSEEQILSTIDEEGFQQTSAGVQEEVIKKPIEKSINQPILSSRSTLYVYRGRIRCEQIHRLTQYRAYIDALDTSFRFLVFYCQDCRKFIMKYDDYEGYLQRYRFFPIKVQYFSYQECDNYNNRADYSPLSLMGYTVRADIGLSQDRRQSILAYIMDHEVLEQREVLNYLEMFIRDSKNRPERAMAVSKWRTDKEFVLAYKLSQQPEVIIVTLVPR